MADVDAILDHYRALDQRASRRVVERLLEAGFSFDHTGGNIYVWLIERDGIEIAVVDPEDPSYPPDSLSGPVVVSVSKEAQPIVAFEHPRLSSLLDTLEIPSKIPGKIYALYWISADRQADIPMGTYPSAEAAEAAIPGAERELLGECVDKADCAAIRDGSWSVLLEADD